jgi:hypothetical protein
MYVHVTLHLVTEKRRARYRTLQRTTGELAVQSNRQVGPTEGGLAYAVVVAWRANPQQPSGPHKPPATRRISLGDMSGPLCDMPHSTTLSVQEATSSVAPAGKRRNKTPQGS